MILQNYEKNKIVEFNVLPDCGDLIERESKVNQPGA